MKITQMQTNTIVIKVELMFVMEVLMNIVHQEINFILLQEYLVENILICKVLPNHIFFSICKIGYGLPSPSVASRPTTENPCLR